MNKNNSNSGDNSQISKEKYAAKLTIIAGAIVTLGDFLALVAAALEVEEIASEELQSQQDKSNQEDRMLSMQKQIDYLTIQLSNFKK
ncbi:hypothetical protein [Paenibacillus sp. OV219]|uniref:hypothetical protein n=1 Tax=Paenibacillus sp. OV219 TaxID=1884377 RepID=UPI0008B69F60|nr:hypothetical protein [Paenibacillus sp. OV219]SEP18249.1 hypothetical protein SAMN05518847_1273 [Paenibacillus sp. OV219]